MELAKNRDDIELHPSKTGSKREKDILIIDPRGVIKGKLFLNSGQCWIKNPNEAALRWMIDIANALNGRVVDHVGRTFTSPTDYYLHPEDKKSLETRGMKLPNN